MGIQQEKVVLDIETDSLPAHVVEEMNPPVKAAGNLKDPAKIAADIQEKREKMYANAALSALTGKVVAYGWWQNDETWGYDFLKSEEVLLKKIFELVKSYHIVTFNGNSFDLPFLIRRGWVYGIDFHQYLVYGRYLDAAKTTDLRNLWTLNNPNEYISLDHLARHLRVGQKIDDVIFYDKYNPARRQYEAELATLDKDHPFYIDMVNGLVKKYMGEAISHIKTDVFLTAGCGKKMNVL